jgi:hypothetical protein
MARRRPKSSSDNNFCSERPNSSSDDLRADAAATRPSPTSPLEGRGQAECRRVGGQSVGGTDYLVFRAFVLFDYFESGILKMTEYT